jgi:hypothetical protein
MTTLALNRPMAQPKPLTTAPRTTQQALRTVVPAPRPSFLLTLLRALGAPAF